mgnify:CR=1 FL=1|tara:strand:+ start:7952 stop:8218 length:267 start_codon:yes stop_codon:yes gene_type:complete
MKGENMVAASDLERIFASTRQEGGDHYKKHTIQPYTFAARNNLSFFQGNVIKYVVRYKDKNGIEDLRKIIHYCELEIEEMRNEKKNTY